MIVINRFDIRNALKPAFVRSIILLFFLQTGGLFTTVLAQASRHRTIVASSQKLNKQEIENLIAFTKVFGYVRYFYPGDSAAALDWNRFAIYGVKAIQAAKDSEDLAAKLQILFHPVAPTVQIFCKDHPVKFSTGLSPSTKTSTLKQIAWVHQGVDVGNPYHYLSERKEKLSFPAQAAFPDPAKPFATDLIPGIRCIIPLSLYADSLGTLPHQKHTGTLRLPGNPPFIQERAVRLADVVVAWNVFQHLYPYFDALKQVDWNKVLRRSLKLAAQNSSAVSHCNTMRWMQAQLKDGHGTASYLRNSKDMKNWRLPFKVEWIENHLVVGKLLSDTLRSVQTGDIITKINHIPAADFLLEQENYIPGATKEMKRWWSTFYFSLMQFGEKIDLELLTGSGQTKHVSFYKSDKIKISDHRPPDSKPQELKKGVYYIDLEWFTYDNFEKSIKQLSTATGIIFDVRGYPDNVELISHLIDAPISTPPYFSPLIARPERNDMKFIPVNPNFIQPRTPRFHGKIVFLTGPRAMSKAEHLLAMVKRYKLGTIIGESTAGTNGNINWTTLPSGYDLIWTAHRTLQYDGSQFIGVGVHPDREIHRTLNGFRQHRDEVLDRALEIVSN